MNNKSMSEKGASMEKRVHKKRRGLTMVEIIIVIVIIAIFALLAFTGGKRTIASAKISVVQSDYHTFELAAKQLLLEHPEYIKLQSTATNFNANRVAELNRYLPDEMQLSGTTSVSSAKLDQWSQNYRVMFVSDNINSAYFRIYIISSGPNVEGATTTVDKDDLVMSIELKNGDVRSKAWGFTADNVPSTAITSLVP